MNHPTSQHGNVLFLILIAVALFAALSYAVTSSSRTGAGGADADKAKLLASDIVGYGTAIEQAISRMRIINRVAEHGLDLHTDDFVIGSTNATCGSTECRLFLTEGGNVPPKLINRDSWDQGNTDMVNTWQGRLLFRTARIQDVGSDQAELLLVMRGLSAQVCAAINDRLKIANEGTNNPPDDSFGNFSDYTGTLTSFPEPAAGISFGDEASQFIGKRAFCTEDTTSGSVYMYIHTLLGR